MNIDWPQLRAHVEAQFRCGAESIHGVAHWQRVERNGLVLAARCGAVVDVVRLFALFHDSQRAFDDWDDGHGARAAEYLRTLWGTLVHLDDANFERLHYACAWHTAGRLTDDPTIGACWDADRLDLGRALIQPNPAYMSTAAGRELARLPII